jgi:hypothetical protein
MDWSVARGAAVSACALALAGVVGSAAVPVGPAGGGGADPGAGSLWSSGAVDIEDDAGGIPPVDSANLVGDDPWARRWLRVCATGRADGNCGVCRPCQLALARLWLAGEPDAADAAFDHPVDPAVVRSLAPLPLADDGDVLGVLGELRGTADGWSTGRRSTSPDERLVATALADAWASHLERTRVSDPADALSA